VVKLEAIRLGACDRVGLSHENLSAVAVSDAAACTFYNPLQRSQRIGNVFVAEQFDVLPSVIK
jgi:hypothetical protein